MNIQPLGDRRSTVGDDKLHDVRKPNETNIVLKTDERQFSIKAHLRCCGIAVQ